MRESWTRMTSLTVCDTRPLLKQASQATNIEFSEIDVVTHHGVEAGIGRAMFQTFFDIGPELGLLQLLDVQHGDIGHGSF